MKHSVRSCHCEDLYQRLKQQEDAIAQLVDIIGATNRRLYDLDQRQHGVEHQLVREYRPRLASSSSS